MSAADANHFEVGLALDRAATSAIKPILAAKDIALANYARAALRAELQAHGYGVERCTKSRAYATIHKPTLAHSVSLPVSWRVPLDAVCRDQGMPRATLLRAAVLLALRADGYAPEAAPRADVQRPEPPPVRRVRRLCPPEVLAAFTATRAAMGGGR